MLAGLLISDPAWGSVFIAHETQITQSPAFETTPTLGTDGTGDPHCGCFLTDCMTSDYRIVIDTARVGLRGLNKAADRVYSLYATGHMHRECAFARER